MTQRVLLTCQIGLRTTNMANILVAHNRRRRRNFKIPRLMMADLPDEEYMRKYRFPRATVEGFVADYRQIYGNETARSHAVPPETEVYKRFLAILGRILS